jgi:BRO family, N-terminal domain
MSSEESTPFLLPLHYAEHTVRAWTDERGVPWWIAQDVGEVLGMLRVRKNLRTFPDSEKGVTTGNTPGGRQEVLTVNEPGLSRRIFPSRKPEAEAFTLWVFHDILPSLRRVASYAMPEALPKPAPPAPSNHLPPRGRPAQDMAHVSERLLAVWATLRQAADPMTNTEMAGKTRVPLRTVQRHTKSVLQLGWIDLYETRPSHRFMIAEQADKRHAASSQR